MTFKDYMNEVDVIGGLQRFGSHFAINQKQNVQNMFNTIKKDIKNILANLNNSSNTFLNKLNYDYANELRKFYEKDLFESAGAWAGAAAGLAAGGPVGVLPGALAGHYGAKAVNYFLPANMQLRKHIRLEKVLLGHLKTLLYMIENARDQEVRQYAHSDFSVDLDHLISSLDMWQRYYDEGGTGELYGTGYGRKYSDLYRHRKFNPSARRRKGHQ